MGLRRHYTCGAGAQDAPDRWQRRHTRVSKEANNE